MDFPKVSIIILNWNGLKDTIECIESCQKLKYPNYEIIVVDNGSINNEADEIARKFPGVVLLNNGQNLGFAAGNNAGMEFAFENNADYAWLLNNDAIVAPDALSELIKEAETDQRAGLLSSVVYYYHTPAKIQFCGSFVDWQHFLIVKFPTLSDIKSEKNRDICLWGTALLVRRNVYKKIGGLNEKFFAYYEDSDYSLRSLRHGFVNKIASSSRIFHKSHAFDEGGYKNQPVHYFFYMTRNGFWFWQKNIPFFRQLFFLVKYLARIFRNVASCLELGLIESASAALDGLYSAFLGAGGAWGKHAVLPRSIKKIIFWHPYFLADLFDLNFKNIFAQLNSRILKKKVL